MKKFLLLILAVFFISGIYASDDDFFFSEDSMFFDDVMLEEITEEDSKGKGENSIFDFGLIETDTVSFGGSTSFSLDYTALWADVDAAEKDRDYFLDGLENSYLVPNMSASLYFDARPNEALRFYGKAEVGYPFEQNLGKLNPMLNGLIIPQFRVKELFTDFNIGEHSYFRFGKHTVKWGVGYFFSPADVINIGKIDPEHPENQVEGAITLRSMFTFPGNQNCLYLYLIPDESGLAKNTAFAGKYDFLVGNTEIGLGTWLKYNRPPKFISTMTTTLFNKIATFGEAVVSYGTEEEWLGDLEKSFALQGTLGFSYSFTKPKITLLTQYLFNGYGDENPETLDDVAFASKQALYSYVGKHYLAVSLSKSELISKKLSLSCFGLVGLSDFSGNASLNLNYQMDKNCSLSLGPSYIFGKENSEFTKATKDMLMFNISVKLGGGKF